MRVERSVCSARVRPSTTGSTASRWLGFEASVTVISPAGAARALGAEVVLDVAGAALGIGGDCLEGPLALELAQDRLVGAADHMGQHVQPAAVGHAEHDLVAALLCGEGDRLVQHRHHHVQSLDRELLLAEERPAQVALEALDLGQPLEQRRLSSAPRCGGSGGTRSPSAARRAARGRRCARSRRRSCRSRPGAAAGARPRASRPARGRRGCRPESAAAAPVSASARAAPGRAPGRPRARRRADRAGRRGDRKCGGP